MIKLILLITKYLLYIMFTIIILISIASIIFVKLKAQNLLENKKISFNPSFTEVIVDDYSLIRKDMIVNCQYGRCKFNTNQCRAEKNPRLSLYNICKLNEIVIYTRNSPNIVCGSKSDMETCLQKVMNLLKISYIDFNEFDLLKMLDYSDQFEGIEHLFYDSVRSEPLKILRNDKITIFHENGFTMFHSYNTTFEVRMKSSFEVKLDLAKRLEFKYE